MTESREMFEQLFTELDKINKRLDKIDSRLDAFGLKQDKMAVRLEDLTPKTPISERDIRGRIHML